MEESQSIAVAQGCCVGMQYIISVNFIASITYTVYPPSQSWMTKTGFVCRCKFYTWASDTAASSCALVPMIVRADLICGLPDSQMTEPASDVCGFHFGSHIKRTVFAQQFPWLWDWVFLWAVKLSGSLTVETLKWEHIQMKQWDVWRAPSTRECRVTHLLWPQGVLNCSAARTHTHTHIHTGAALSQTHFGVAYTCPHDGWRGAGYVQVLTCVFVHQLIQSALIHFHLYHFTPCQL